MASDALDWDTQLRFEELDPERPRLVETPWGTMALFVLSQHGVVGPHGADRGEVVCVQAFCPHLEGPLFQGSVSDGCVTCPWHFWRFDLRSGKRVGVFGIPFGTERLTRLVVTCGARDTLVLRAPTTK